MKKTLLLKEVRWQVLSDIQRLSAFYLPLQTSSHKWIEILQQSWLKAIRIMRWLLLITGLICCTAYTLYAGNVKGQSVLDKEIDITLKDELLKTAIDKLATVSGARFSYSDEVANSPQRVSVSAKKTPLKKVLNDILTPIPFKFLAIEGEIVVWSEHGNSFSEDQGETKYQPIDKTVSGVVTDSLGMPLPGVTVQVKGTSIGTATNINGEYVLSNIPDHAELVFSMIGYTPQVIYIDNESVINIILKERLSELDEALVIGYGVTSKRFNTGNVSKVSKEIIDQQPITNPLQALSGRVPGLQIVQSSGLPGTPMKVEIRGRSSIAANNNPLYVIDGVPFISSSIEVLPTGSSAPTGTNNSIEFGNPLNLINPADIESIEILKDADAVSIYGSRGANGVILITTRKGREGNIKTELSIKSGLGKSSNTIPMFSTEEFLELRKNAFQNSNMTPSEVNAPDLTLWSPSQDNNWQDWYIGGVAESITSNLALSGGSKSLTFRLSGNYHKENTVLPGESFYQRAGINSSLTYSSINHKFKLTATNFYNQDIRKIFGSQSIAPNYASILRAAPNMPIYNEDGSYYWPSNFNTNWVAQFEAYSKNRIDNFNNSTSMSYFFSKGLSATVNIGYNRIHIKQINATPSIALTPVLAQNGGNSAFANRDLSTYIVEPQVNYNTILIKGDLSLLIGGTYQNSLSKSDRITAIGYSNDLLLESLSFGTVNSNSSTTSQYKYLSVFGRLNYNWDRKYVLNANFRRDGSSKFGPGKRFGNFGSLGVAWVFSNEAFFKLPWLSHGKLRGSYGTTGNDGIGDYGYLSLYRNYQNYGSEVSIVPSQIGNSEYRWELNRSFEVALELSLFQERVYLSSSWYDNRSSNQLVGYSLPSITGFRSYQANLPAKVRNKGVEFELDVNAIDNTTFKWSINTNLTVPKNKLLDFPDLENTSYANTYVIGEPLDIIQGFEYEGTDKETGFSIIKDINNDGSIIQSSSYNDQGGDYVIIGRSSPQWYGGLNNQFRFKNWQLDVFLNFAKQQGYNLYAFTNFFGAGYNVGTNAWQVSSNYWVNTGDENVIPKPFATSNTSLRQFRDSSAGIEDASYLRVKNIALSYNLSNLLNLKANTLSVGLQMQNAFTITNYSGYDPENAGMGYLMLPTLKQYSINLNWSF